MPVHRPNSRPIATSSNNRKTMGFSINDIIQSDEPTAKLKTSPRHPPSNMLPAYLPQTAWLPPPPPLPPNSLDPLVQYQLHYLRHSSRLFDSRFTSPEAAAALILHSFRKPKRVRTAFTPAQLLKLENAFEKNHYVVGQERKELARHLNLTETQVKVWYQNRRTKHKRLKSEDGHNSSNEINEDDQQDPSIEGDDDEENSHDHRDEPNQSETSDTMIKTDDEHSWDTNHHHHHHQNNSNTTTTATSTSHYPYLSTSISDRYYLHLKSNERKTSSTSSSSSS